MWETRRWIQEVEWINIGKKAAPRFNEIKWLTILKWRKYKNNFCECAYCGNVPGQFCCMVEGFGVFADAYEEEAHVVVFSLCWLIWHNLVHTMCCENFAAYLLFLNLFLLVMCGSWCTLSGAFVYNILCASFCRVTVVPVQCFFPTWTTLVYPALLYIAYVVSLM
jgi:hypothetical protein